MRDVVFLTTVPGVPDPGLFYRVCTFVLSFLRGILRKFSGSELFWMVSLVKIMDATIWIIQAQILESIETGVEILEARAIWGAIMAIMRAASVLYLVMQHSALGQFKEYLTYKAIRNAQLDRQKSGARFLSTQEEPQFADISVLGLRREIKLPTSLLPQLKYDGDAHDLGQIHRKITWAAVKYSTFFLGLPVAILSLPEIRKFFFGMVLQQSDAGVDISANFCLSFAFCIPIFVLGEAISNFFLSQRHFSAYFFVGLMRDVLYAGFSHLFVHPFFGLDLKEWGLGLSAVCASIVNLALVYWFAKGPMHQETQAAHLFEAPVYSGALSESNEAYYKGTRHGSVALSTLIFLALVVNLMFSARMNAVAEDRVNILSFVIAETFAIYMLRVLLSLDRSLRIGLATNHKQFHSDSLNASEQSDGQASAAERSRYRAIISKHVFSSFAITAGATVIFRLCLDRSDGLVSSFINQDEGLVDVRELGEESKITVPMYMATVFLISAASLLRTTLSSMGMEKVLSYAPFLDLIGFVVSFFLGEYQAPGIIGSIACAYAAEVAFFSFQVGKAIRSPHFRPNRLLERAEAVDVENTLCDESKAPAMG